MSQQRWMVVAVVALAVAAVLVSQGCQSRPEGHTPQSELAAPPAVAPPATGRPDEAFSRDLAAMFRAFADARLHGDKLEGMTPQEWCRLFDSILVRAWADLDTYLLLLRELSSKCRSSADFLAWWAERMNPGNAKGHMSIAGRVAELLPFLGESVPHEIRVIAAQPLCAHGWDVQGNAFAQRLQAHEVDLVVGLLDSSQDETLVKILAEAFSVYADRDGPINDWFLRSFAAAGPGNPGRLRLLAGYVVHARLSGPIPTTIAHALDVLGAPDKSELLHMLWFRSDLGPDARSTILPAAERVASSDPDPSCRGRAMAVLFKVDDPEMFARISRLLAQEPDAKARTEAVRQLASDEFFDGHPATEGPRFKTAMSLLGDPCAAVAAEAVDAGFERIRSDLRSRNNVGALKHGGELVAAIKPLPREREAQLGGRLLEGIKSCHPREYAMQLKALAVEVLSHDWPEALDYAQVKAELDTIK